MLKIQKMRRGYYVLVNNKQVYYSQEHEVKETLIKIGMARAEVELALEHLRDLVSGIAEFGVNMTYILTREQVTGEC